VNRNSRRFRRLCTLFALVQSLEETSRQAEITLILGPPTLGSPGGAVGHTAQIPSPRRVMNDAPGKLVNRKDALALAAKERGITRATPTGIARMKFP